MPPRPQAQRPEPETNYNVRYFILSKLVSLESLVSVIRVVGVVTTFDIRINILDYNANVACLMSVKFSSNLPSFYQFLYFLY